MQLHSNKKTHSQYHVYSILIFLMTYSKYQPHFIIQTSCTHRVPFSWRLLKTCEATVTHFANFEWLGTWKKRPWCSQKDLGGGGGAAAAAAMTAKNRFSSSLSLLALRSTNENSFNRLHHQ